MKVLRTQETTEQKTIYYIGANNDMSKVLFDSYAGYCLLDINEQNDENQSRLWYTTSKSAEERIRKLYEREEDICTKYNLQVHEHKVSTVRNVSFFAPIMSDEQFNQNKRLQSMAAFETFYAGIGNISGIELQRQRDLGSVGYHDQKINAAFENYMNIINLA